MINSLLVSNTFFFFFFVRSLAFLLLSIWLVSFFLSFFTLPSLIFPFDSLSRLPNISHASLTKYFTNFSRFYYSFSFLFEFENLNFKAKFLLPVFPHFFFFLLLFADFNLPFQSSSWDGMQLRSKCIDIW